MRTKLITLITLAAMLIGGLAFTNTAEARPWRGYYGGYYGRVVGPRYYYGPSYYGPTYYRSGYYRPNYYYGGYNGYVQPYRTYYGPGYYYGPGVSLGVGPARIWVR